MAIADLSAAGLPAAMAAGRFECVDNSPGTDCP